MVLTALPTIRLGAMDLPVLHTVISFFIPLVLVLAGVTYSIINYQTKRQFHQLIYNLADRIKAIPTYGLDQVPVVAAIFAQTKMPSLQLAFERLQQDQDVLYQQRWLPDPSRELTLEKLISGTAPVSPENQAGRDFAQHWPDSCPDCPDPAVPVADR